VNILRVTRVGVGVGVGVGRRRGGSALGTFGVSPSLTFHPGVEGMGLRYTDVTCMSAEMTEFLEFSEPRRVVFGRLEEGARGYGGGRSRR